MKTNQNSILIVDDNHVDRKLLAKLFKKRNCRAFFASNGVEAIQVCREQSLDLILMNLDMPVMNGFEATKEIRRLLSQNRNQPIIGITSDENDEERFRCLDSGMNDYYQKPIKMLFIDYILDDWLVREEVSNFAVS